MVRKVLVTSALPYINNIPHLGNLIGSTLSADVYARHKRLQGRDVLYVCGADEHGTTTEIKAREEGLSPQELCDKYVAEHERIYEWFGISFDVWGRTHTKTQTQITQDIFSKLYDKEYIFEEEVEQLYDPQEQQYLSDRYVEGECPHCGSPGARGDQCDACQQLLSATELKNPVSKLSGATPVKKKTKHLFIDLPKLKPELEAWLDTVKPKWSKNTVSQTEQWLEDLEPRAITRDLEWGVPVPLDGYEDKVFYVWFDAPIGYISITAHDRSDWEEWWKDPDTRLVQFMGKDNIVFHSVIFPSTLIGTGEEWALADTINTTEYLNMKHGKFSKSRHTGVFGDDCIEIEREHGIPADAWRYYLLANRPEKSDTEFSFQDFQTRTNNELIATLANLVHRTLTFVHEHLPDEKPVLGERQEAFLEECKQHYTDIQALLDDARLRPALQEIMALAKHGNKYFQHAKPWETKNTDPAQTTADLQALTTLVKDLSILTTPYTPTAAKRIQETLGTNDPDYNDLGALITEQQLKNIEEPAPLFEKLDDDTIMTLEKQYTPGTHPLDLRAARITAVREHPDADKLYVLDVDLGSETRQLVAGLKPHYSKEELEGPIVVVANLEPAVLRGQKSEGMLLASESEDAIGVLRPDAKPGTKLPIGGKQGRAGRISFDEFQTHTLKASADGVSVDGEPLDADITVDRGAYGNVR